VTFEEAIAPVLGFEGRYSNNPADRGGETAWGITVAVARAFGYQGAMKDMARPTALAIYRERFWTQPRFDQVALVSAAIGYEMLEQGVNFGPVWPGRFLQRALNVLNQGGTAYPDVTVDGAVGKLTLFSLAQHLRARATAGERVLLEMLNSQQSVRYMEIAEQNPSQEEFEYGWQRVRVS
jgi:lysozyme family protein